MKTKRNLSASIPNETRKAVYARDGYRCALCDDTHGLQIHHIVHRSYLMADKLAIVPRYTGISCVSRRRNSVEERSISTTS